MQHEFFSHHVKSVEASKRCSDLLHYLGLIWEELLQNSRSGEHLLDLLGSRQVSADIRTFHSQRALHQKSSFPSLQFKKHFYFSENFVYLVWQLDLQEHIMQLHVASYVLVSEPQH